MTSSERAPRWYFGGLASAIAAGITHPLDLVKVHMQTPGSKNPTFLHVALRVAKSDGLLGLYNGISASLLRQITYSFPRFGIYELYKNSMGTGRDVTVYEKIAVAGFSGLVGGLCGQPADLVNVRMQNDMKRPAAERRNYKHCFDGLIRVYRQGGLTELYSGASMMGGRSALMTVGQAVGYDQCKAFLIWTSYFKDDPFTHTCAGVGAAAAAVLLTQPFDVMKTRMQNAQVGQYNGLMAVAKELVLSGGTAVGTVAPRSSIGVIFGLSAFFKGITPAFVRIGPHTILLFLFKEQLTKYFGFKKNSGATS